MQFQNGVSSDKTKQLLSYEKYYLIFDAEKKNEKRFKQAEISSLRK